MFKRDLGELREEKVCSPLAIAVSVGEPKLVEVLLTGLNELEIEVGLEVTSKASAHLKANVFTNRRRRSPL